MDFSNFNTTRDNLLLANNNNNNGSVNADVSVTGNIGFERNFDQKEF